MTLQSILAQYPPDNVSFLRRAAPCHDPSSLSICVEQEMRPDVKHDSSLTRDLLVARPLLACISDENKKLLIWKITDNPWVSLSLSYAPFILLCLLPWFANLDSFSFCLDVLCSCFPSFYLLLRSGSDDVKAKHPPLCSGCWQPRFAKDLEMWGEKLWHKVMWPAEIRTLRNWAVAVRRNMTALERLWSRGGASALSRVLALTGHNTNVWSERLSTFQLPNEGKIASTIRRTCLSVCLWL